MEHIIEQLKTFVFKIKPKMERLNEIEKGTRELNKKRVIEKNKTGNMEEEVKTKIEEEARSGEKMRETNKLRVKKSVVEKKETWWVMGRGRVEKEVEIKEKWRSKETWE